ncbi:hypothetical protein BV898_07706 [Hypsibius exemplaris]|uniref:Uncharacterized protein n=1 Tax=Hypsibius exemplaris TaxID=2072580 RepID=A0A1W0WSE1_HYPEX|nr:hypothetical protein BV898_07706 [Hypsibius exemplaris]
MPAEVAECFAAWCGERFWGEIARERTVFVCCRRQCPRRSDVFILSSFRGASLILSRILGLYAVSRSTFDRFSCCDRRAPSVDRVASTLLLKVSDVPTLAPSLPDYNAVAVNGRIDLGQRQQRCALLYASMKESLTAREHI